MMRSEMGFLLARVTPRPDARRSILARTLDAGARAGAVGRETEREYSVGNGNLAPVAEGPRVYLADAASAETRRAADTGEPTEERPDAEAKMNRRGF